MVRSRQAKKVPEVFAIRKLASRIKAVCCTRSRKRTEILRRAAGVIHRRGTFVTLDALIQRSEYRGWQEFDFKRDRKGGCDAPERDESCKFSVKTELRVLRRERSWSRQAKS